MLYPLSYGGVRAVIFLNVVIEWELFFAGFGQVGGKILIPISGSLQGFLNLQTLFTRRSGVLVLIFQVFICILVEHMLGVQYEGNNNSDR